MIRIGINGFGRIGRLVFRAAWARDDVVIQRINDPAGDAATQAHLLNFDSIHGRWQHEASANEEGFQVNDQQILVSQNTELDQTDWGDCDLVIEASGTWRSAPLLQPLLDQGVKRVVATAPIKQPEVLNVVMGINDHLYDPARHPIVTAAS
ncbi:MAG: type I glyceraldehyde-3-phosphate dehydrogenase, partial [Immundisolibacteraceae bacterium]|nr:type I glyceraldehyde-3-phosphate dehydrogenase [Immundisolibacteraceae bacterium]